MTGDEKRITSGFEDYETTVRKKIEEKLEELGVILFHPEGFSVARTWDIAQLHGFDFDRINILLVRDGKRQRMSKVKFAELYANQKILSEEDYQNGEQKKRHLFYYPSSSREAFDARAIRKHTADTYLKIWDIGRIADWNTVLHLADGSSPPLHEIYFAQMVFGEFQGERDAQTGMLTVWDEEKGQRVKFSATWFYSKTGTLFGNPNKDITLFRPTEYLTDRAPHLLESGLFRIEDVGSTSQRGSAIRREMASSISSRGEIYLDGARYNLGTALAPHHRPDITAVAKIDEHTAAIIKEESDGSLEIDGLFPLASPEEKATRRAEVLHAKRPGRTQQGLASYLYFGKVSIRPYDEAEFNNLLPGESHEEYEVRIGKIVSVKKTLNVVHDLSIRTGISIHREFSWPEQEWLATVFSRYPHLNQRISTRAKKLGPDFLHSFYSCSVDLDNVETILLVAELLGSRAQPIFEKYATLVKTAQAAGTYLRENFGQSAEAEPVVQAFVQNMLMRGDTLLRSAAARGGVKNFLHNLSSFDVSTAIICSGVAALKGEKIPLSEVKPFHMDVLTSQELREHHELLTRIRASYERSLLSEGYADIDVAGLLKAFDVRVNDPNNASRFYIILRLDAKNPLIGFTVFTDTAQGEKFWSALTIEDAYKRSGFYSSILMQALEHESKDVLIRGEATAGNDITASYIEHAHFDAVRYHYLDKERVGILTIERPIKREEKPEVPRDISMFGPQEVEQKIEDKTPLIAFEVPVAYLTDRQQLEELFVPLHHGYVLVRYSKDAIRAQLVFKRRDHEERET